MDAGHSFSLNDTVTSVSFEARANYLRLRSGNKGGGPGLLQPFLARELSLEPANVQVNARRRRDCVCTPVRGGGGERRPVSSDGFLPRPGSSAHAVFLMKRAGLRTSLPGYKRRRRGQKLGRKCGAYASKLTGEQQQPQRTPPPHQTKASSS